MIASPCVQICRMQGDMCIGCLRTLEEITDWSKLSDSEKLAVLDKVFSRD